MLIPQEAIASKIFLIRGRKVMLDRDLAGLYGVKAKVLNQAVKRNRERFPADFMFKLTKSELENWRSQFVTSNSDKMGLRRPPHAFTDYGILMLSSVLNSKRAIQVNIAIMRVFVRFRQFFAAHKELALKISELEKKVARNDKEIQVIFEAIRQLMLEPERPKPKIGFHKV
jgi:hypothetical protein